MPSRTPELQCFDGLEPELLDLMNAEIERSIRPAFEFWTDHHRERVLATAVALLSERLAQRPVVDAELRRGLARRVIRSLIESESRPSRLLRFGLNIAGAIFHARERDDDQQLDYDNARLWARSHLERCRVLIHDHRRVALLVLEGSSVDHVCSTLSCTPAVAHHGIASSGKHLAKLWRARASAAGNLF